jgi:putative hydrolase of the HAD superfamily
MKHKAVIFDLFGTLIDNFSSQSNTKLLTEMASVLSLPTSDFIKQWVDSFNLRATGNLPTCEANIKYVSEKIGLPVNTAAVKEATKIRFEFTARSIVPRLHAIETLSYLKKVGYKTGLISDCSQEVPVVWKNTPFAKLIDVPVFSCEAGVKKPDPRIYQMTLQKLNAKPSECIYVGDGSSHELTGALEVGMYPVLIRVPYEISEDSYRIDEEEWHGTVISSLKEVLDLLQ